MKKIKIFKDPIYEYINIPENIVSSIIDTPEFQRLRSIRQTSYAPLYSSSLHNRFTHSLGVYHLSRIVSDVATDKLPSLKEKAKILKTFQLACLLHDVGHSPFSHSGEDFFLNSEGDKYTDLNKMICDLICSRSFKKDVDLISQKGNNAKPHEIMSAIISLENFGEEIEKEYKEFFTRCILGYEYTKKTNLNDILNFFIRLLNSKIIDIDKLDYIIRDSFITGYQSVSIDYTRLLQGIYFDDNSLSQKNVSVFHKNALSIIENVVFAHDSERKWIQNHPAIVYENYLIQYSIKEIEKEFSAKYGFKLFCKQSLSSQGITKDGKVIVRLLSDEDVLCYMKKKNNNPIVNEFFDRNKRRHAIWKSEAEFKAVFDVKIGEGDLNSKIIQLIADIEKMCSDYNLPVINYNTNTKINEIIETKKKEIKKITNEREKIEINTQINNLKSYASFFKKLEKFSIKNGLEFDYVFITSKRFTSNFNKIELKNTEIFFPNLNNSFPLHKVSTLLNSENSSQKEMFYIFCKRPADTQKELPIKFRRFFISYVNDLNE